MNGERCACGHVHPLKRECQACGCARDHAYDHAIPAPVAERCAECKDTDGMVSFRDPNGYAVARWKQCDHVAPAPVADCGHEVYWLNGQAINLNGGPIDLRAYPEMRRDLMEAAALRAEVERLRAIYSEQPGGTITYVERCDSCETFRQRMIAEKARAEKAERERDEARADVIETDKLHADAHDEAVGAEESNRELARLLNDINKEKRALVDAVAALYYSAYWHADRHVDEVGLWVAVRDAAGLEPGQTAQRLGPERTLPLEGTQDFDAVTIDGLILQRDAAEARIAALTEALRGLHGRTGLCHGAIMGYGCREPFHNPKCATAALEGEK